MIRSGALPNLIVIGAGRCGTTSLHKYLDLHPEIAMSALKELNFFSGGIEPASEPMLRDPVDRSLVPYRFSTWSKGIDWYKRQFDPASPIRGESSPAYSDPWHARACAERIVEWLPDVRLIYCVRDPIDRAVSSYRKNTVTGHERRSLEEALIPGGYYAHASRLALRLEPFLERFGAERIFLLEREDLEHRRAETMRDVFRFLEVDEGFSSEDFELRWDPADASKARRFVRIIRQRLASVTPRSFPRGWVRPEDRRTRDRSTAQRPQLSAASRERLAEALAADAERLRRLTGRDFAAWSV